jgi:hypothetical protein
MLGDFTGPIANLFSAVKIAEGESPAPIDRVFHKSNYYNNVQKSRWANPFEPIHKVDVWRNTLGMEKTFFNQSVSLGLRIPFDTINAESKPFHLATGPADELLVVRTDEGFSTTLFGNISAIAKAVVWEDRTAGDVISAGLTTSFPTASNKKIDPGMSSIAFMQPFTGFLFNGGNWYLHGFSSITLPLVAAESIVAFNDLGVGYWMVRERNGLVTGLVPTVELHIASPLRQIDPDSAEFGAADGLRVFNVINVTMGATMLLSNGATVGLGMVVPLTGPKPFDVEVLSQFNYRF